MSSTERFDLNRKIVAAMTSDGWRNTPHASFMIETDATRLTEVLKEINAGRSIGEAITFNTAMMKIIVEGLKACPKMNGHVKYSRLLVRGKLTLLDEINVTMPVLVKPGTIVTLNVRGVEKMSMTGIRDAMTDLVRRARNSHLPQVMYDVGFRDTLIELKRFHFIRGFGRLLGFCLDRGKRSLLHGKEKKRYEAIPESERLTWRDMEQGTVTVSNPGSLLKSAVEDCTLMEIVPPQVAAVAIDSVRDKAVVGRDGSIRAAKTVKLTVIFDHRALDGSDCVPFVRKVCEIMGSPEVLKEYL